MMNIEELDEKLNGWRKARSIDENSTAEAQHNCYLEELEEFKDAIGDMVVCLLNEYALSNEDDTKTWCSFTIKKLESLCKSYRINFGECLEMAWSEIEHRAGLVRSTGKFTKWKDLTHEERVKVALSGQLIKAPQDIVDGCKKLCTPSEWEEIRAAEISIDT